MNEDKLRTWFKRHSIRCLSPLAGGMLLDIYTEATNAASFEKDPDVKKDLSAYCEALMLVATVGGIQQSVVIDKLAELIGAKQK